MSHVKDLVRATRYVTSHTKDLVRATRCIILGQAVQLSQQSLSLFWKQQHQLRITTCFNQTRLLQECETTGSIVKANAKN